MAMMASRMMGFNMGGIGGVGNMAPMMGGYGGGMMNVGFAGGMPSDGSVTDRSAGKCNPPIFWLFYRNSLVD